MELIVTIGSVGAYAEYDKKGSAEKFKCRGLELKHGGSTFYGEMTGNYAVANKDTEFFANKLYVVSGYWRWAVIGENNFRVNKFTITDIRAI